MSESHQTKRAVYGTFFLDRDEYAIELEGLQEVVNAPDMLQKMPLSPPYLEGLHWLRGRVLPVVELRNLLQLAPPVSEMRKPRPLAVIRRGKAVIGLLFDRLGEMLQVKEDAVLPICYYDHGTSTPIKAAIRRADGSTIQVLDHKAIIAVRNLPAVGEPSDDDDEAAAPVQTRMRDLKREKLLGFSVGGCELALDLGCVNSVLAKTGLRPSPKRSSLCEEVVMVRECAVPVVKTARLLKVKEDPGGNRILVCLIGGELIGFEADSLTGIIPYTRGAIAPIPVLEEHRAMVFRGNFTDRQGKDFIVLNEDGLLTRQEIVEISLNHPRKAAPPPALGRAQAGKTLVLTFRIGNLYGFNLSDVVEVVDWKGALMRTPDTPAEVMGLLNLRGTPVPVVDPRPLFRIGAAGEATDPKILVLRDQGRRIGMRVDSLDSIVAANDGANQTFPDLLFRGEKERFGDGFSRGIQVSGKDTAVVMLRAAQVVERLAAALAA